MPGPLGEGVNSSDARFMRDVVLKQLLFNGPRSKIWAVTGSSMALFWQSLALMPRDGCSPLQGFYDLQLPASFPEAHMQASLAATSWAMLTDENAELAAKCNRLLQNPFCVC